MSTADLAIRVEHLGKRYRLGTKPRSDSLREALIGAVTSPLRRLRRDRQTSSADHRPDHIWALKDVSFEVRRGEVVGIIGRNGAGKSTLLKILSRITEPTEGYAEIYGRVGSLLEVGTGFHPELTGRENIYLNGAILGMRRAEIDRKFDEIVAFAEIDRFLDTPVKHYSSGMYVRLAFAVAAHLQPEILLVDEVLAVGDAAFQKKCLGKMGDVAKEGRTVLFVSHNMAAVGLLCGQAILLQNGIIEFMGATSSVIEYYLNTSLEPSTSQSRVSGDRSQEAQILSAYTQSELGTPHTNFHHNESPILRIEYIVRKANPDMKLDVRLCDRLERSIFTSSVLCPPNMVPNDTTEPQKYRAVMRIPAHFLTPGRYHFLLCLHIPSSRVFDRWEGAAPFEIVDFGSEMAQYYGQDYGCVFADCTWKFEKIAGPYDLTDGL